MRVLVSVATTADARAAVEGGADIVDAKDPSAGALGAVTLPRLREICDAVAGARPLTAALGDAAHEAAIERHTRAYAEAGASLVKVGLLGTTDAVALLRAAVRGVAGTGAGVVAVAYADAGPGEGPSPVTVLEIAVRAGARGVLIDTLRKDGPGLLGVMPPDALARWIASSRTAGLLVALAGKLTEADLTVIGRLQPDIVGVRGAACIGGRSGYVSADLVRLLKASALSAGPTAAPAAAASW